MYLAIHGVIVCTIQCSKNSIEKLYSYNQQIGNGRAILTRDLIDGYWNNSGTKLIVRMAANLGGDTPGHYKSSFILNYNSNLTTATYIFLNSDTDYKNIYQFLNDEYLINGNNQIYKINDSSVSLYETASNISISNKQAYDKIITLNNCFYLYFSINNNKIYVYKYDAGFNFTFEKEISWAINSTNAAYSYLMYCPIVVNNVIKYNELDKIKEIYTTTDNPDFASLERNGIKYFNTSDSNISAGDVLENKIAYGKTIKIMGTMPNNGELNYEVSTSEQTIPEGYTSGGTIAASPLTDSEYDECLETTQQILGQSASL